MQPMTLRLFSLIVASVLWTTQLVAASTWPTQCPHADSIAMAQKQLTFSKGQHGYYRQVANFGTKQRWEIIANAHLDYPLQRIKKNMKQLQAPKHLAPQTIKINQQQGRICYYPLSKSPHAMTIAAIYPAHLLQ